ncbi:MAG: division/cell wall cluster transcriptional repressor MraZ [Anaerolineales bacterium]|nr:division/cell wall cluster transcriptional repressor MraZ [Anaerolineales bacterium]
MRYTVGACGIKWEFVGRRCLPASFHRRVNVEHMFLGQFTHSIDTKGRITIPVRFRAALSSGAYVTQGFERNLIVYTTKSFERLAQRASTLTTTDPDVRAVMRVIFGRASEVSLDSSGRILVPPFLRDYAHLEGESVLVGAGQYFEIWSGEAWEQELASVVDPEINARRFTTFDLSTG